MSRLVLLNGMPGVGKSTLARRYAADHPGTLNCDIDALRRWIGGWQDDFDRAGERIRPAALAMITAYLRESGDVVVPQLLGRVSQMELFERAATRADAELVEVMLVVPGDDAADAVRRFGDRDDGSDPWHRVVQRLVADAGGDQLLHHYHAQLAALSAARPATRFVTVPHGDIDGAYNSLVAVLDGV